MARKRQPERACLREAEAASLRRRQAGDDRLNRTAGDAAALLTEQLAGFGAATRACLSRWENANSDDTDDADYYLNSAVRLAEASAKLGDAVARMKSESRQHISVERVAHGRAKVPLDTPPPDGNALNSLKESDSTKPGQGEGG
jgi:hypothetical protein